MFPARFDLDPNNIPYANPIVIYFTKARRGGPPPYTPSKFILDCN
jgi:hypothetical protein